MKTILKTFLISIIVLSSFNILLAQTTSTSEILGNDKPKETDDLDQKEVEREADFLNQLLLDIPVMTDNPSHIITFIDPSDEKVGVQLEIDGKSFQEIKSPYSLPALSIGKHELRFRFVDKYGSTQILEKEIIVIPRPPIINSPTYDESNLIITGTGLSNSEIILILSSNKSIIYKEGIIDGTGKWEIRIERAELKESLFTFSAYTRKYGYASNLAEPITFEIGGSQSIISNGNGKEIYFKFKSISFKNLGNIIKSNTDLLLLAIGIFLLGFATSSLSFLLFKNKLEDKKFKIIEKKITENNTTKKEMTLKERLSAKKEATEEKKEEEPKEEEKIVTKIDFLKDFKVFDPDNEKGEEKDNIKVTLTSKD
jgi:hypothetical protein